MTWIYGGCSGMPPRCPRKERLMSLAAAITCPPPKKKNCPQLSALFRNCLGQRKLTQGHASFQQQPTPGDMQRPRPTSSYKGPSQTQSLPRSQWSPSPGLHGSSAAPSAQSASFPSTPREFTPRVVPYKLPSCYSASESLPRDVC